MASGQPAPPTPSGLAWSRDNARLEAPVLRRDSLRKAPLWAPLVSGLVPGSGQLVLRQQRSAAYAVAEVYLLLQYLGARRDGDRDKSAYRQLARDVARRAFGGTQPDGPWEYYERMEHFLESGVYDRGGGSGGPLLPENDESTYNGNRWRFAREIYWRDPDSPPAQNSSEYRNAIAFYERTAIRDEYRWSWRDATLEQTTYQNTIASANRNYQRAVNYAGVLIVNHLVSLVDSYVSVRVRRFGGAGVLPVAVEHFGISIDPMIASSQAGGVKSMQLPDGRVYGQISLSLRLTAPAR